MFMSVFLMREALLSLYVCPTKVAGGSDIIKQSLRTFVPTSMATVMLVDLISYDGFPAMAALEVAWFHLVHQYTAVHDTSKLDNVK